MHLSPSSPAQAPSPPLLHPSQLPAIGPHTALFLDFDGTLVDLAPDPEAVQVSAGLVPLLAGLSAQLGGALAIVSGRKLSDLDGFLAPLRLPAASEHGAQRRLADGRVISLASPDVSDVARRATELAARHPELLVEIKSAAVSLHYRHAPALEALCLQTMQDAVAATPGLELLHGKYVYDVKPAGVSKGTAIQGFMAIAPFAGRIPLFAGDDTTDEAGFAAVQSLGGEGIKVGDGATLARHRCLSPQAVRQWLQAAGANLPEGARP